MITRFKQQINMPYSLHDMVVNNITYKNESVYLKFEHGFVSTEEPYRNISKIGKCEEGRRLVFLYLEKVLHANVEISVEEE